MDTFKPRGDEFIKGTLTQALESLGFVERTASQFVRRRTPDRCERIAVSLSGHAGTDIGRFEVFVGIGFVSIAKAITRLVKEKRLAYPGTVTARRHVLFNCNVGHVTSAKDFIDFRFEQSTQLTVLLQRIMVVLREAEPAFFDKYGTIESMLPIFEIVAPERPIFAPSIRSDFDGAVAHLVCNGAAAARDYIDRIVDRWKKRGTAVPRGIDQHLTMLRDLKNQLSQDA